MVQIFPGRDLKRQLLGFAKLSFRLQAGGEGGAT